MRQGRINVEEEFAVAVRKANGEVVDDMPPTYRDFPNADYLFRNDLVVAEMKCLRENKANDPQFVDKLATVYRRLMMQGRVPMIFGTGKMNLRDIAAKDERAAFEFLEVFSARFHPLLRKANQQIKQTAKRLNIA